MIVVAIRAEIVTSTIVSTEHFGWMLVRTKVVWFHMTRELMVAWMLVIWQLLWEYKRLFRAGSNGRV